MKIYYIYLIVLSCAYIMTAEGDPNQIMPHVNVYPQINVNPDIKINLTQTQSTDQKTGMVNEQTQSSVHNLSQMSIQESLQNFYETQTQACHNVYSNITTYLKNNKIKSSCALISTMYGYIAYQIYIRELVVKATTSWSNWRNHCNFEEFLAIPCQQAGGELLQEIQQRYADPTNPTNFIYSLVQFTQAIDHEILVLEEQMTIYTWLNTAKCSHLFFVDAVTIANTQAKLHKLLFIKHVFSAWCAMYKIEKNSLER